ncbi:50S ribosomal protein L13, partial [Candidatus Woesearchaeota archaeon]|nr:50S ribosomal protein L13 [Candidatus Woesearchaeota archaeon]
AKKALLGEKVDVVNCEQAIMTGRKQFVYDDYNIKRNRGTFKGPFIPRMPDRFVRRIIRGMLPHKQDKGREALERIMCHLGVPSEFEGKELVQIKEAHRSKLKNLKYVTIKDICKKLGHKQ